MVTEEWRPIPGHPGYEVSNLGQVRSYRTLQGHPCNEPRIMKLMIVQGYWHIKLGRSFQSAVHRLVALAFLGPRPRDMECRHLDGNRLNPELSNLAYGTREQNYHDRHRHGTDNSGERHGNSKLTNEQVDLIRNSQESSERLAQELGVTVGTVSKVRFGRAWRHLPGTPEPRIGRPRGIENHKAKLDEHKVRHIRTSGSTARSLADRYGVSTGTIYLVRQRKVWAHV